MKVELDGLVRILYRRYNYEYSKEEIKHIIEMEGSKYFDKKIEYVGFGFWEIPEYLRYRIQ